MKPYSAHPIKKILKNSIQCLECGQILESKYRHGFQKCKCKNEAFVDGGLVYLRRGAVNIDKIKDLSIIT